MFVGSSKVWVFVIGASIGAGVEMARAKPDAAEISPVEDPPARVIRMGGGRRGVREVIGDIARQLALPVVVDPGVNAEVLDRGIELELRYSRAREVMALLSDLTGLGVHLVDGTVLVRPEAHLPGLLEACNLAGMGGNDAPDGDRLRRWQEDLLDRVASVDLEDATVVRAAEALRGAYPVDIVVEPEVVVRQALITLPAGPVSLREALRQMCRQSESSWEWRHGAVWVQAMPTTDRPKPGPEASERAVRQPWRPAVRYHLQIRETPAGKALTHLRDVGVNTSGVGHPSNGRIITLEAMGTGGELCDLMEALPIRADALP